MRLDECFLLRISRHRETGTDLRVTLAREFQLLSSMRHPNIISVLDYGFDADGQPYYTMESIKNAQMVIEAGHQLIPDGRIQLLVQILQALLHYLKLHFRFWLFVVFVLFFC